MNRIFQTIEKVRMENSLSVLESSSMFDAAMELLESRYVEMPVVDRNRRVVGMISEKDLLKAIRGPLRLEQIMVKQMMSPPPAVIDESMTLSEASRQIEGTASHRLPVVREGILSGTITRHDILRAWLGVGLDVLNPA